MTELRKIQRTWARLAPIYDLRVRLFMRWRDPAARALAVRTGDTVLDLACGTGLNFPHLARRIGARGRIVGVDCTRAMLRWAQRRSASHRWDQVALVEGDAAALPLADGSCDAVLCTYAMVIIPDYRRAIAEAVRVLRPGGRMVLLEGKRTPGLWGKAMNPLLAFAGRFGGVDLKREPWRELAGRLEDITQEEHAGGIVYIASGTKGKVNGTALAAYPGRSKGERRTS